MKKSLLLVLLMLPMLSVLAQDELYYGTYTGTGTLVNNGTQKAETYDVAMHVADPALVGMSVIGMRIPVVTKADASDYKAWLSSELGLDEDKNVVTDIASVEFSPKSAWVDVTFTEPYVITAEGLYAGYSLTVNAVTSSATDVSKKPLVSIAADDVSPFFIHTSRTYRKWQGYGETTLATVGAPAMVLRLAGEGVHAYAAAFKAPDELSTNVFVDEQANITFPLVNHGTANITSIDYELTVGTETLTEQARVTLRGPYYGRTADVKVPMPVMSKKGSYESSIRVVKINGEDNLDPNPTTHFTMVYVADPPKHKPLMEEYTGTWCQYCPIGMLAMEKLTELYGDDFVGVAFHNGDAMTITSYYPNDVNSFPNAYLDRVENVSPYYGTSSKAFGIKDDWKRRSAIMAPATIELRAAWADEAQTKLQLTSTTTFMRAYSDSPYQLTYILTADGLKGTGKYWSQANAYAGSSDYADDPYMSEIVNMPGTILNMEFNDVAIQLSSSQAMAMEGCLPAAVEGDVPYEHSYTFDIAGNELVQDKTKLRPVVVLINTRTGEAVNAEKISVNDITGIEAVETTPATDGVQQRYDLQGRPVGHGYKGVVISRRADGSVTKQLNR